MTGELDPVGLVDLEALVVATPKKSPSTIERKRSSHRQNHATPRRRLDHFDVAQPLRWKKRDKTTSGDLPARFGKVLRGGRGFFAESLDPEMNEPARSDGFEEALVPESILLTMKFAAATSVNVYEREA
ncbi:unnamed protein product [Arabis nemorensis]|uniref:Uncharacterized protein n=1 Tax=Arabis nemorensis TaxID=586526 RepID=A0A565AT66_9BRAS|nr:unnamed protein product [Arabis nemorensis]